MGKWKSRYGDAFVAFPSILDEDKLEYEVMKLEKGSIHEGTNKKIRRIHIAKV